MSESVSNAPRFDFWCGRERWTVAEAAYLLAGHEPPSAAELPNVTTLDDRSDPVGVLYRAIKDALLAGSLSASAWKDQWVGHVRLAPSAVVTWANDRGQSIAEPFTKLLTQPRRETPEQRRERLTKWVKAERARGTKNFLQVVAKREGISVARLKQLTPTR